MSSREMCGISTAGVAIAAFGVEVDLTTVFLTFMSGSGLAFSASFFAGFAIFLAGALTAFAEVVVTLAAVDWLVFLAGIGTHLSISFRDLQNNSSKKSESDYLSSVNAFLIRWMVTTVAVFAAEKLIPGINCSSLGALLGASLLLGIINAFVRPFLLLLSIPFIILTMGLFIFVVNALLLLFVAQIIPAFHVEGFWNAFFGAIIISIVSWILSSFFRASDGRFHTITHHPSIKKADARVIK